MIKTKQQLINTLKRAGTILIAVNVLFALAMINRIFEAPRVERVLMVGVLILAYAGFMLFTGWQLLTTAKYLGSGGELMPDVNVQTSVHRPTSPLSPTAKNLVANLQGMVAAERRNAAELQQPSPQPGEESTLGDPRLNSMSNDDLVREMKAMLAEFVRRGN